MIGRAAPPHLPRHLLLRVLAYRVQAYAFGDLSRESIRLLGRIADGEPVPPPARKARPGAVLVREWEGVRHHVVAVPGGFAWNGATYPSLSVARAITGTSWNGPRFFGLREKRGRAEDGRPGS